MKKTFILCVKSIEFILWFSTVKLWFLLHVCSKNVILSNWEVWRSCKKSMKNLCRIDAPKSWKIIVKMAAKMSQNPSKYRSWGDLWPLILWIWAFWSVAKTTCFFCTFLEAQKTRKVGPGCGKGVPWGQRGCTKDPIFGDLGPWAPTRAKASEKF